MLIDVDKIEAKINISHSVERLYRCIARKLIQNTCD